MPGAGTDKTKRWIERPGPVVVLVEPQMGENIGAAARAMANFGLGRLRLVKPKQGWPNEKAVVMAAGATRVLDGAQLYETLEEAVADCSFVLATTARHHDQLKPIIDAQQAAAEVAPRVAAGDTVALVFGRERNGLENHEVGLADRIVTLPVNPAFASLNLAQAVIVVAYEWFKLAGSDAVREDEPRRSPPVGKQQLTAFFRDLERELEKVEFFRPAEKRETMVINLRNIFTRMELTQQDVRTLYGVVMAIANGRKGPARGGTLDPAAAEELRGLIADHSAGQIAQERAPIKGLARLLRRNPTEAERAFWKALTADRRFADYRFKRQVPLGPHMGDLVSIPLRCVIEIIPANEPEMTREQRPARHAWLAERNYRVITVAAADVLSDVGKVLDELAPRVKAADQP
ncbi:MAG TPA: TrmJ/YjtD family RNA methyltransferase [Pseudolabrys sp.]|nr:TrmJ/YjtD family RNA methyltransferase [Pseudolabrys sp.]